MSEIEGTVGNIPDKSVAVCKHPTHMLGYDPELANICPCGWYAMVPVNPMLVDGIPDLGIIPLHMLIRRLDEAGQPLG